MSELKILQRRLIPVNIVVSIIALVAAISLMFAPLLTIDVGIVIEQAMEIAAEENGENSEDVPDGMMDTLLGIVGDMKLTLTTFGMLNFAYSDNPTEFIMDAATEKMKEVEDDIIANVAVELLPQLIEDSDIDLGIDNENIDVPAILDKFDGLFDAKTEEQTKQAIGSLVDEIQSQAVTTEGEQLITEEMKAEIADVIEQLLNEAKAELGDEDLTLESFICVTISKFLNGDGPWEPAGGARSASSIAVKAIDDENTASSERKIYTNYRDLISGIMSESEGGEGSADMMEDIEPMLETAIVAVKYLAIVMSVFAGIWAIQFLFAFLHIFGREKRFTMWYTKLFGFCPCLIFGIVPIIAAAIIPSIFPEAAAYIGIFSAISTLTWISGICYILLWLVSIFWAFPIKHKIRKLRRQGVNC